MKFWQPKLATAKDDSDSQHLLNRQIKKKKEEKFSYQSESDIHTVIIYTHNSHSINTNIA